MLEDPAEAVTIVPALMEGFEDVSELFFVESVEVGDHSIEFVDYVLFLSFSDRAARDADGFGPSGKAVVRAGEPSCEFYDTMPSWIITVGTWYGNGLKMK